MQKDFVAVVTERVLKRDETIPVDTKQVISNASILPVHRCIHVVVHFGAPRLANAEVTFTNFAKLQLHNCKLVEINQEYLQ